MGTWWEQEDAIANLALHDAHGQALDGSHGALWHIFSQADTRLLQVILPRIVRERGTKHGNQEQLDSTNALLDGCLYLDDGLLAMLREEMGIVPYVILQRLGDAILVPAGCALQAGCTGAGEGRAGVWRGARGRKRRTRGRRMRGAQVAREGSAARAGRAAGGARE